MNIDWDWVVPCTLAIAGYSVMIYVCRKAWRKKWFIKPVPRKCGYPWLLKDGECERLCEKCPPCLDIW